MVPEARDRDWENPRAQATGIQRPDYIRTNSIRHTYRDHMRPALARIGHQCGLHLGHS